MPRYQLMDGVTGERHETADDPRDLLEPYMQGKDVLVAFKDHSYAVQCEDGQLLDWIAVPVVDNHA